MHTAVVDFLHNIKKLYPHYFSGVSVLEFGSLNINGTVRDLFVDCQYTGVDTREGWCVDVVSKAHEFKSNDKFDVLITTEMLEHDKYAKLSLQNGIQFLKTPGILIGSCANINRPPHCLEAGEDNFYENISKETLESWMQEFNMYGSAWEDVDKRDLYFVYHKSEEKS